MQYVGIDPSFTKTGVCYLDLDNKTIKFVGVSPEGRNDHYVDILNRSAFVAMSIIRHFDLHNDVEVIIEEPLMGSYKASSLGMLSGITVWSLAFISNVKNIYSINPKHISSVNKHLRKKLGMSKKAVSKHVASEILEYFIATLGYDVELYTTIINKDGSKRKRALSHDEAEAFLLLITLLIDKDIFTKQELAMITNTNRKMLKKAKITHLKGENKIKEGE
jgi:hypothetical protein